MNNYANDVNDDISKPTQIFSTLVPRQKKTGLIEYMDATTLHPPRLANLSARTIEILLIQTRRKHKVSSKIQYMYLYNSQFHLLSCSYVQCNLLIFLTFLASLLQLSQSTTSIVIIIDIFLLIHRQARVSGNEFLLFIEVKMPTQFQL